MTETVRVVRQRAQKATNDLQDCFHNTSSYPEHSRWKYAWWQTCAECHFASHHNTFVSWRASAASVRTSQSSQRSSLTWLHNDHSGNHRAPEWSRSPRRTTTEQCPEYTHSINTVINRHIDKGMSAGCSSLFLRPLSHWKVSFKSHFQKPTFKKNFQVQTVHLRKFIAFESYFHKASAYGSRVGRTHARRRHTSYFHSIEHVLYCESNFWKWTVHSRKFIFQKQTF